MISAQEVKKIRVMVKEEEKWFMELENLLIDESGAGKIRPKSANDVVRKTQDNEGGVRVCDLCSVACNRWLTDDLLDFMFTIMNAGTTSHHFQVISEPLMLSQSFRMRVFDVLKGKLNRGSLEFVDFALNVRRCPKTGVVSIRRNGNHRTYFSLSVTLDEIYYGDSLGMPFPENLLPLFEPIFPIMSVIGNKVITFKVYDKDDARSKFCEQQRGTLLSSQNSNQSNSGCQD